MIWHIIPINDTMIHEESMDCSCGSEIDYMEDNEVFITHNAQDAREEENNELVLYDDKLIRKKKTIKKHKLVEITNT